MQENIPLEEVFENLRCTREGLTTQQAEERLAIFGHNKLEEKKVRIGVPHSQTPPFFFFFPEVLDVVLGGRRRARS